MTTKFQQPGDVLELTAPAALSSNDAFIIGNIFAVALEDAASGAQVSGAVEGVYEIPKLSTDNMTVGLKVNWNDTNKEVQLAAGDLDDVATVVEAAGASTTVVKVKLTPL